MSFASILPPLEAALPAAQFVAGTAVSYARPLLGIGMLAALLMIFKPLLIGVLRAALLVVKPRQSLEERTSRRTLQSVLMLNHMARDVEISDPALASELRALAARG